MMNWITGTITAGYGVASGQGRDPRYPEGTIRLQQRFFLQHGIDLSTYFPGTLNVDVAPVVPVPRNVIFDGMIRWFENIEERFILSPAILEARGKDYSGLWYYPHPDTKPDHFQRNTVVELLLPWIDGLAAGDTVRISL